MEEIKKTEENIKDEVIKKIQNLIENSDEQSPFKVKLSEDEHLVFNDMINQMKKGNVYMKDIYREEYSDEDYYYDATPEEQEMMDQNNGNDYLSIRIGEKLFLNEDFDRYRKTSTVTVDSGRLHGDESYKYGDENFDIDGIITPEELIEEISGKNKISSSLSVEELQEIVRENNEQIIQNDKEIKQALIKKILEQQQIIEKQKEEIYRLNNKKEIE